LATDANRADLALAPALATAVALADFAFARVLATDAGLADLAFDLALTTGAGLVLTVEVAFADLTSFAADFAIDATAAFAPFTNLAVVVVAFAVFTTGLALMTGFFAVVVFEDAVFAVMVALAGFAVGLALVTGLLTVFAFAGTALDLDVITALIGLADLTVELAALAGNFTTLVILLLPLAFLVLAGVELLVTIRSPQTHKKNRTARSITGVTHFRHRFLNFYTQRT
jgi:hypothetical protein